MTAKRKLMNESAATWAASQTWLNLHDSLVLLKIAMLCHTRSGDVEGTTHAIAATYQLPHDLVVDCVEHLVKCAYLTPVNTCKGTHYRVNYMQTNAQRRERAGKNESSRALPHQLITQPAPEPAA